MASSAGKRWGLVIAGIVLVGVGFWLLFPARARALAEWLVDNPGVLATAGGVLALSIGLTLIRRGLKRA